MLRLLAVFLFTFMVLQTIAVDITTLDGKEYHNAKIVKKVSYGIIVNYTDKEGFDDLVSIGYNELPENIRKKYGYNPANYQQFETQHQAWINDQTQKQLEQQSQYENSLNQLEQEDSKLSSILGVEKVQVMFSALSIIDGGTVGWAREISPAGTELQSMGRICLLGQTISPYNKWSGYVYPVPVTKYFNNQALSCYADYNTAVELLTMEGTSTNQ